MEGIHFFFVHISQGAFDMTAPLPFVLLGKRTQLFRVSWSLTVQSSQIFVLQQLGDLERKCFKIAGYTFLVRAFLRFVGAGT